MCSSQRYNVLSAVLVLLNKKRPYVAWSLETWQPLRSVERMHCV